MAARSISSRQSGWVSTASSSLTRSQSSLHSARTGYSFSSGYTSTNTGFNFSSYISSSASSYSSLATTTPVSLRRKTSGLSRQEYKTRSKSVDVSQIYEAEELQLLERHKPPTSIERCLSTERDGGLNTRVPARRSSVFGAGDQSRESSVSRASSVLPHLEPGDETEEKIRRRPVRNRQSHGVSQYDLERAATWAMIGSNKSQEPAETQRGHQATVRANSDDEKEDGSQIDYKKLWEESQAENARLRLEINTVRFDLEVARRQLVRVKEEKLCQVERIFVVQKIAKLEDDLKESPRLQSENKKLLSENKALSRVVTKLSNQ